MSTEKKVLTLKTSDGQEFEVEESLAIECVTIKNLVEDDCASSVIPLPNVNHGSMAKIVEYLKKHADETVSDDDKKKFDDEFFSMSMSELIDVMMAANYLNHQAIMDLCSTRIADGIKNKSPEKVRQIFNVVNDYSPEEEAALREEHEWTFDGIDAD